MDLVDRSGWIEYFLASVNADCFAGSIEGTEKLIVSVVSL